MNTDPIPPPSAEPKICPRCGTVQAPGKLLLKCVVCESVYCPACSKSPTVHPFWGHQQRRGYA